jgi:hypothetical protein
MPEHIHELQSQWSSWISLQPVPYFLTTIFDEPDFRTESYCVCFFAVSTRVFALFILFGAIVTFEVFDHGSFFGAVSTYSCRRHFSSWVALQGVRAFAVDLAGSYLCLSTVHVRFSVLICSD